MEDKFSEGDACYDVISITPMRPLPRSAPKGRKKKGKLLVTLSGTGSGQELTFALYPAEIRHYEIEEEGEISREAYEEILIETLIPRAKKRAMHLLTRQDRTKKGLSDKLFEGGYPAEAVEAAISYVESYHYIDDERYAQNYVFFHKGEKSKKRLLYDLLSRGVAEETAESAISEMEEEDGEGEGSDVALIRKLVKKKRYEPEEADVKAQAKMYRYLASRGFSYEDIKTVIG